MHWYVLANSSIFDEFCFVVLKNKLGMFTSEVSVALLTLGIVHIKKENLQELLAHEKTINGLLILYLGMFLRLYTNFAGALY